MIIDHDLKLVLLHVPKCAGTSLRRAFLEDGSDRNIDSLFDFAFNPVLQRQVDLAHLPLMDLRHFREWRWLQRYRVIACIRHPYARLASACREFLRQNSRATEVQVRTAPPSREQLLTYLRRLPAAMDTHDLRWVHGFPIHWFTHYGHRPKVHHLIRCSHLNEDLTRLGDQLDWPASLRQRLAPVAAGAGLRPAEGMEALEQDPDLRAMANLLHAADFDCFGFPRAEVALKDPTLQNLIDRCLVVGNSHDLPLTNLTPEMRWYYGRQSPRPVVSLRPTRRWRPQR